MAPIDPDRQGNDGWPTDPYGCMRARPTLPTYSLCPGEAESAEGKKLLRACEGVQDSYKDYLKRHPENIYNPNLQLGCVSNSLAQLGKAIREDHIAAGEFHLENAHSCLNWFFDGKIDKLDRNIEIAEFVAREAFIAQKAAMVFDSMLLGGAVLGPFFGTGVGAASGALPTTASIAGPELAPIVSAATYGLQQNAAYLRGVATAVSNYLSVLVDKYTPPSVRYLDYRLNQVATPISNYVTRLANTEIAGLNWLRDCHLIKEPTLNGLNNSIMTIYGGLSILNVLEHAGDEPDAEQAKVVGESLLGEEARTALGIYGNAAIAYLLGCKIFNLSPLVATVFTTGHIFSEFRIQHNSSGVSFKEIDWVREEGGEISALLTLGPMNALWNGFRIGSAANPLVAWKGWANYYPKVTSVLGQELPVAIPSAKAIAAFVASSGAVNSALFVPIGKWLERANLENFWTGLTAREFTLSVPRKVKQAIFNPNSVPSILIYHFSKVAENEIISRFYSLFAGTDLYREPMHSFLSDDHSPREFTEYMHQVLNSCALPLCETYHLEEDAYKLMSKDINRGEFSGDEVTELVYQADRLLVSCNNLDDYRLGLGLLAALTRSGVQNAEVDALALKHGDKLDELYGGFSEFSAKDVPSVFSERNVELEIEAINDGELDETCTPEERNPPASDGSRGAFDRLKRLANDLVSPYERLIDLAVSLSDDRSPVRAR